MSLHVPKHKLGFEVLPILSLKIDLQVQIHLMVESHQLPLHQLPLPLQATGQSRQKPWHLLQHQHRAIQ